MYIIHSFLPKKKYLNQGCSNPVSQVARQTKFYAVAQNNNNNNNNNKVHSTELASYEASVSPFWRL